MSPVVLCVDDRRPMLDVRKDSLERFGFQVETATNAPSAIATLERRRVTAVLLEYKLEGLDAEAIAFHIKQRFPDQPVLLLTGYSDVPERILWLVDEYIMRSEPLERLVNVVERLESSRKAVA